MKLIIREPVPDDPRLSRIDDTRSRLFCLARGIVFAWRTSNLPAA
jgi:hypothetical protein